MAEMVEAWQTARQGDSVRIRLGKGEHQTFRHDVWIPIRVLTGTKALFIGRPEALSGESAVGTRPIAHVVNEAPLEFEFVGVTRRVRCEELDGMDFYVDSSPPPPRPDLRETDFVGLEIDPD